MDTQGSQYPLIKEYTSNYRDHKKMMSGILPDEGVLGYLDNSAPTPKFPHKTR